VRGALYSRRRCYRVLTPGQAAGVSLEAFPCAERRPVTCAILRAAREHRRHEHRHVLNHPGFNTRRLHHPDPKFLIARLLRYVAKTQNSLIGYKTGVAESGQRDFGRDSGSGPRAV
jgi:hypothetical protein